MTTPTPWSLVERGEDSQGRPLYDIVSESADLIVARDLWLEDGEAILKALAAKAPAEALPLTTPRGFRYAEIPFTDYDGTTERVFSIQESSLATQRRLWFGPTTLEADLNGDGTMTVMERAHITEEVARQIRDALAAWLGDDAEDEPGLPNPYVRKPGSEGKPWSDPESDPLADMIDAADRARRGLGGAS